jgi:sec-independent protein translocase protein TatC
MGALKDGARMSLLAHVQELLERLRVAVISVITASCLAAFLPIRVEGFWSLSSYSTIAQLLLVWAKDLLLPPNVSLIAYSWFDAVGVYAVASLSIGIVASLPLIAYEAYRFVNPALYSKERKILAIFMFSFTLLFLLGAFYAYKIVVPVTLWALTMIVMSTGALPLIALEEFVSLVFLTIIFVGLAFTFPIAVYVALRIGLLKPDSLKKRRKWIYGGLFLLLAPLTPDPTPIADIVLMMSIILLLETAIRLDAFQRKNRDR